MNTHVHFMGGGEGQRKGTRESDREKLVVEVSESHKYQVEPTKHRSSTEPRSRDSKLGIAHFLASSLRTTTQSS